MAPTVAFSIFVSVGMLNIAPASAARIEIVAHDSGASDRNEIDEADADAWPWSIDTTGPSPWEQYRSDSTLYCKPWVSRSTCPDDAFRGLAVYFHGYSACAEQVQDIAPQLNAACLDVLAPTLPGMGGEMLNCDAAAARAEEGVPQCSVRMDNGMGFDLTDLPTHSDQFRRFTWMINDKVRDEFNFRAAQTGVPRRRLEVGAFGLSFGAAMATFAIRSKPSLYSKQLLVNPFFGIGAEDFDQQALDCDDEVARGEKTQAECREEFILTALGPLGVDVHSNWFLNWAASNRAALYQAILVNLAKLSDNFGQVATEDIDIAALRAGLDATTVWGETCNAIFGGRKGICAFKQIHALASHSFCFHALVDVVDGFSFRQPATQVITTERDGQTRNGMSYAAARAIGRHRTSMCMYRFQNGTDRSNAAEYWNDRNSMKHAALEGRGWWTEQLFRDCTDFLVGDGSKISGSSTWDGSRTQCMELPLDSFALHWHPDLRRLVTPEVAPSSQFAFLGALFPFLRAFDRAADITHIGRSATR